MSEHRPPDFDDLVGEGLEPDEHARLLRVHELLVAAGPPPELPPELEVPEEVGSTVVDLRRPSRRRLVLAGILAAALAAAAFGAGFFLGDAGTPSAEPQYVVQMTGDQSRASLAVFPVDKQGNWPMEMTVQGLPNGTYDLWLTKAGKTKALCGSFAAGGERPVKVTLNAPFVLKDFDGWVVTRAGSDEQVLRQVPD